jgi:hypothetical protein
VVALAQDTALPKVARLKAWLTLMEYCYPKLCPIASHENMSARLEELQRSWDTATLEEFKQAFSAELDTLPDEAKAGLKKLEAMGKTCFGAFNEAEIASGWCGHPSGLQAYSVYASPLLFACARRSLPQPPLRQQRKTR